MENITNKSKKKLVLWMIGISVPVMCTLFIIIFLIIVVSGKSELVPDIEPEMNMEFKQVANYCGIPYTEWLAYITVMHEDFEGLEPEAMALDYLFITYKRYHEESVYGQSGSSNAEAWVLDGTFILDSKEEILRFARATKSTHTNATKIVDHFRSLDSTQEYDIFISSKEMRDFYDVLTEDQQDWYNFLISENIIEEVYGTYYELPENILVDTVGYFAWPVPGITYITSPFGWREDPVYGNDHYHRGVDVAESNCLGKPVIAAAAGKVIDVQYKTSGYGYSVLIEHTDSDGHTWQTRYAHLNQIIVDQYQEVTRGHVIGAVGNTGKSTGPHLHFEIKYEGTHVDPLSLITPQ